MKRIQKIFAIGTAIMLVLGQLAPIARAFDVPAPPEAPTAPSAPEAPAPPTAPEAPTAPSAPEAPAAPGAPTEPTADPSGAPAVQDETSSHHHHHSDQTDTDTSNQPGNTSGDQSVPPGDSTTQTTSDAGSSEGSSGSGNVGDTTIDTGNAGAAATSGVSANSNVTSGVSADTGPSVQIGNSGNGAGSTNSGSASISNNSSTIQNNTASVVSGTGLSATTGNNDASKNVGNSTITTGDANVTGTLITAVNTNIDGMMVSEFNVVDDHVGDIVLDFAAGCISGCTPGASSITNTGNGSGSTNTGTLDTTSTDTTFQTNDATVSNGMVLKANSGDNSADKNTGGNSTITTGDANVDANLLTFANNNIAGDVIYGVVNIYGNLKGDIILPESALANCCVTSGTLANTGNGSGSTNTTNVTLSDTNSAFQTNTATIDNTLLLNVDSGNNETSKNTGGNSSITTGDTSIDANVLNVANTNLDGATWWLVLVNQAGQWIGHILGADGDAAYAGSAGTDFTVSDTGAITVTNKGNGADSTNTAGLTQTNTDTTVQTNTAHVANTVDLTANTGGNSASKNTGGDSTIQTGDAKVIANIVNFVNNNIIGKGKLVVTVVNVFGSWIGDFVTPGSHKAQASADPENSPSGGGGQGGSSQSQTGSTTTSTTGTGTTAITYAVGNGTRTVLRGTGSFTGAMVLSSKITQSAGAGQTSVHVGRTIHINLAWLILLLPCAILLFAGRKITGHLLKKNTSVV